MEELKRFERLLIKLVVIQFVFFMIGQFIHIWGILPEAYVLSQYEGVTNISFKEMLETFLQK